MQSGIKKVWVTVKSNTTAFFDSSTSMRNCFVSIMVWINVKVNERGKYRSTDVFISDICKITSSMKTDELP